MTRGEWGADESLRFDASGTEIWPRETDPVRGLVVHHTKTPAAQPDPAGLLRRVYAFHAVDRGWGDLGYHLLVDSTGLLYEGRAGAAAVLDGDPVVIAGHVYGHNHGNVGVALLGTHFDRPPSDLAWGALVEVLSWLSARHGLDPAAVEGRDGATVSTIRAHRDLRDTTCPGDALYATLPRLRAEVAAATAALVSCPAGAVAR